MKIPLVLKSDVDLFGLRPEMVIATLVVLGVYGQYCEDDLHVVITSGIDGKHSKHSLHNAGGALDYRLPASADPELIAEEIQDRLTRDYDVVLEETHIHVEYQRETR